MKKFEIVIRGANEEAVAHAVMVGVYGAIRKYKHTDVSVQAATVKEGSTVCAGRCSGSELWSG